MLQWFLMLRTAGVISIETEARRKKSSRMSSNETNSTTISSPIASKLNNNRIFI